MVAAGRLTASERRLLRQLFCGTLQKQPTTTAALASALEWDPGYVEQVARQLHARGWVAADNSGWHLNPRGRAQLRVVFVGGVFNILHPGHLHTLEAAKRLGDVLVVSVARDRTVQKTRGELSIHGEDLRARLVGAVSSVDVALLGSETDIFDTVLRVRPDIIALGYDQKHDESSVARECAKRGVPVQVVRLDSPMPAVKTSTLTEDPRQLERF